MTSASPEQTAFVRAVANIAAQYERGKARSPFVYHVHPDSMRAIAALYYAAKPEARGFWVTSIPQPSHL